MTQSPTSINNASAGQYSTQPAKVDLPTVYRLFVRAYLRTLNAPKAPNHVPLGLKGEHPHE
jgi:hypothetical protein